jgi:hypothetical protein
MKADLDSLRLQVQTSKPELSSWLETNLLSSLAEDGFARAIICIPNMTQISAFTSLALARHAGPNTLARLLLLLDRISAERPPAASSSSMLKSMKRKMSSSLLAETEGGLVLSEDQMHLKACCVAIALAQFDQIRFFIYF